MIINDLQLQVLKRALSTWGADEQREMAIGEIGEFLTLFGRSAQNRVTAEDWISEIADVIIMMTQMAIMHGHKEVEEMIAYKLKRLEKKLDKYSVA